MKFIKLILLLLLISPQSLAHESGEHTAWYRSLKTPTGASCCGASALNDCNPIKARINKDGWQILVDNKWIDVPADTILYKFNPVGEPVACINSGRILCFVPISEM